MLERLHVFVDGRAVTIDDLVSFGQLDVDLAPRPIARLGAVAPVDFDPQRMRYELAVDTLERCAGNVTEAARELGVHRSTVHRWIARARQTA